MASIFPFKHAEQPVSTIQYCYFLRLIFSIEVSNLIYASKYKNYCKLCFLGNNSMGYKNVRELTTSGQTCNIKVKVIRLWDSINPSTEELITIDMILMDEKVFSLHI